MGRVAQLRPRSPANPAYAGKHYRADRRRLLDGAPTCAHCGRRPATEADHVPPLSLHAHVDGAGCCRLVASCAPCARRQGRLLQGVGRRVGTVTRTPPAPPVAASQAAPASTLDVVGYPAADAVWDVPWLDDLRDVPADATWPRLMTRPHPDAVDSYGADVAAHADRVGAGLRWWQRLAFARLLEHDDDGRLCWPEALTTTARQVGKSHALREYGKWRLVDEATPLGDPAVELVILHIARKLAVAVEVQRPARRWARARPDRFKVTERAGEQQIERVDGPDRRWMVRAKNNVVSLSADVVFVDEAWDVPAGELEADVIPTTVTRGGQVQLWSTAHRKATALVTSRRGGVDVSADTRFLIVEWSTPAGYDLDDRAGWRLASPHWDDLREQLIADRYAAAQAGLTDDVDEADPLAAFRSQWLNQWPAKPAARQPGEPLLDGDAWAGAAGELDGPPDLAVVAVNDHFGNAYAVAVVAGRGDRYQVDGRTTDDAGDAYRAVAAIAAHYADANVVIVAGGSLAADVRRHLPGRKVHTFGLAEVGRGLAAIRQLIGAGRLCHRSERPDLADQVAACRVQPTPGGALSIAARSGRLDLVKALAAGLDVAQSPPPRPRVQ